VLAFIALPEKNKQPGAKDSTPRLIPLFQNIEVLAVGSEFTSSPAVNQPDKKEQAKKIATSTTTNAVTLALNPQEAILLTFVQEHGKIKLNLRSSEDTQKEIIKPADWDTLFQYLSTGKEGGADSKQPVVEVYRGLNREVVPLYDKEK